MTRRDFLTTLIRLAGIVALPITVQAATAKRHIQQCPLAGFQYHDGEALWPYLTVGDNLQLAREPGNSFDSNAIRIDWNGRKLGYIPRSQNRAAAQLMDKGKWLEARIGGLERHENPWRRMVVEVWMAG